MNKKLTLILLTNLVIASPMVTDASGASDPHQLIQSTITSSLSSSSSSSGDLSLSEKIEQLTQQVNTFREQLSLLIREAFDAREGLGTLRKEQQRLRDQIKEKTGAASRADLIPHTMDTLIQADPDTFEWNGIGEVPKNVTKVRIVDGVTSITTRKLTKIFIPDSVANIEPEAFRYLKSLISIGHSVF